MFSTLLESYKIIKGCEVTDEVINVKKNWKSPKKDFKDSIQGIYMYL